MLNNLTQEILNDYIYIDDDNEIKKYNYNIIHYENYIENYIENYKNKYKCNICEKININLYDDYQIIKSLNRFKKSSNYLINKIINNRLLYNIVLYNSLDIECNYCNKKLLGEIIF